MAASWRLAPVQASSAASSSGSVTGRRQAKSRQTKAVARPLIAKRLCALATWRVSVLDEYAPGYSAALEDREWAVPRPIRGGDRGPPRGRRRLAPRRGGLADLDAAPFVGGFGDGTVAPLSGSGRDIDVDVSHTARPVAGEVEHAGIPGERPSKLVIGGVYPTAEVGGR